MSGHGPYCWSWWRQRGTFSTVGWSWTRDSPLCLLQQIVLCHDLPHVGPRHTFLATPWTTTIPAGSTVSSRLARSLGPQNWCFKEPLFMLRHTGVLIHWIHLRPDCCQHQIRVDKSTSYTAPSCYEATLTMFDMWYKIIVLFQIVDSTDETSKTQYQSLRRAENTCIFMLNRFFKVHRYEFHIHMNWSFLFQHTGRQVSAVI